MATFYNQATLALNGKTLTSNQTEGEIVSSITLTKTAVSTSYGPTDNIVYAVTLVNGETVAKTGISLTDNLGSFTPVNFPEVVPLSYVGGSVLYYQNGVLQPTPTVVPGPPLVISNIDIPAGGNVIILYEVQANEFAPQGENEVINNEVTVDGGQLCESLTATAEIPTRDEPNLSIAKTLYPETVSCGDEIAYTFIIQNTGNTDVVATDNLIVSDTFNPVLTNVTVTLNGTTLTEGIEYNYNGTTGEFSTIGGAVTVPAATFTRDPETGVITTIPGVVILVVKGMV